jgi:hypothetical protein
MEPLMPEEVAPTRTWGQPRVPGRSTPCWQAAESQKVWGVIFFSLVYGKCQ